LQYRKPHSLSLRLLTFLFCDLLAKELC